MDDVDEYTELRLQTVLKRPPTPTSPTVLTGQSLSAGIVDDAFNAKAEITATSRPSLTESPNLERKRLKHLEEYHKKKEAIAQKYGKEVEKLTEKFKRKMEEEAEKIRRELEKQHQMDIEYREKLLKEAIKRQEAELDLEAKHAKFELEHQRQMALDSLEESKGSMDLEVKLDTAIGSMIGAVQTIEDKYVH